MNVMLECWTAFQNLASTLPTMQLGITGGNFSDHLQLSLEPLKATSSKSAVVLL